MKVVECQRSARQGPSAQLRQRGDPAARLRRRSELVATRIELFEQRGEGRRSRLGDGAPPRRSADGVSAPSILASVYGSADSPMAGVPVAAAKTGAWYRDDTPRAPDGSTTRTRPLWRSLACARSTRGGGGVGPALRRCGRLLRSGSSTVPTCGKNTTSRFRSHAKRADLSGDGWRIGVARAPPSPRRGDTTTAPARSRRVPSILRWSVLQVEGIVDLRHESIAEPERASELKRRRIRTAHQPRRAKARAPRGRATRRKVRSRLCPSTTAGVPAAAASWSSARRWSTSTGHVSERLRPPETTTASAGARRVAERCIPVAPSRTRTVESGHDAAIGPDSW